MAKTTKPVADVAAESSNLPVGVPDYIRLDQSRGNENVTREDLQVPRLQVVQALSPELDEESSRFIPDVRAGYLVNVLTGEWWGREGLLLVPVYFSRQYMLWKVRTAGGGLLGVFEQRPDAEIAARRYPEDQVEVVDTPTNICLLVTEDGTAGSEIAISLAKSKFKVSRKWNSLIRLAGGDRFSRAYRVTSVKEKRGNDDFYNFNILPEGWAPRHTYNQALELYEGITAGIVKPNVDHGKFSDDDGRGRADGPADVEDDIPY